jgi:hypothetical protein
MCAPQRHHHHLLLLLQLFDVLHHMHSLQTSLTLCTKSFNVPAVLARRLQRCYFQAARGCHRDLGFSCGICYMFFIVTLCTPARCEAATPATIYIPNPPSECRIPRLCCCKRLVVLDVEAARCFTSTACLEALRVVLCAHVRRMLYKRPVEPCLDVVFG